MSDHEPSSFKVVDRRQAASESAAAQQSVATEEPVEDGSGSVGETDAAHEVAPPPGDSGTDQEQEEEGSDGPLLPDPSIILSIAAMQMDVRTLALALLAAFDGHAWRAMGFLADPKTGETTKDLPSAQLAIDCVQFLLSKLESGMADSERREVQRRLTDLRMNYLSKLREA